MKNMKINQDESSPGKKLFEKGKRDMFIKNIFSVAFLFFLIGCTMSEGNPTVSPTNTITSFTPSTPSIAVAPTETSESGLTITGTVMDVSLSARVIFLKEPVDGFDSIALIEGSKLISENGSGISLQDIQPGFTIQAFGQLGGSNALLASKVIILGKEIDK